MLRITVACRSAGELVLSVDGWLVGAKVKILEEEGTRQLEATDRLVLDLTDLKSIDRDGINLLRRWCGGRVVVRGGSLFVRTLLARHGVRVVDNSGASDVGE